MSTDDKQQADGKKTGDILYCRNFPSELKKRCEGLAGFLGMSITEFVAEILEEETKDQIPTHEAVKQWYTAKKSKRKTA
jgi:hypothetical protein